MPKADSAKKTLRDFQDQYGEEKGKRIYYATANKQGRDPDTFKKESVKLLDDIIIERNGEILSIPSGTAVEAMHRTGIVQVYDPKTKSLVSTNEAGELGMKIAKIMIGDQPIPTQKFLQIWVDGKPIKETVGTGAIAMIPNALGTKKKKKKSKKKEIDEASIERVETRFIQVYLDAEDGEVNEEDLAVELPEGISLDDIEKSFALADRDGYKVQIKLKRVVVVDRYAKSFFEGDRFDQAWAEEGQWP